MNILHVVEFYYPSMGGAQEVVRRLSEDLVRRGHTVTVATSKLPTRKSLKHNGVDIVEFDISGNLVRGFNGDIDEYQNFVINSKYDLIMCYAAQQWTFDALTPILDKITAPMLFVPCGFNGLYFRPYQHYYEQMPTWLKRFNKLVFLSEDYQDINFAKQQKLANLVVIPNGASKDEFESNTIDFRNKYGIGEKEFIFLHVGGHTGGKGHGITIKSFSKAKLKNAKLLLLGNTPNGTGCKYKCHLLSILANFTPRNIINKKKVVMLNPPREDVVAAYKTSQAFLFASNTECSPLVLFESMAAGIPFLTTDAGNASEIIKWSGGGILINTTKDQRGFFYASEEDFIRKIELMYNDNSKRAELGKSGHSAWQAKFTFEKIFSQFESLYQSIISETKPK